MAARIPPAATSPKSTVNRPWNSAMATGIVFAWAEDVKINAYRNSSHARRNPKRAVARSPERASGSVTRNSAPRRLAPSILAASSRSRGMVRKCPLRIHRTNGVMNEQYTTINPILVSRRWSRTIVRYSGIRMAIGGSMYVDRKNRSDVRRKRKSIRANAYAPKIPTAIEMATELDAMIALLIIPERKSAAASFVPAWKMLVYRSNEMWDGIHLSGRASRSTGDATLEIRSQANGARTMTAVRTAAA